MSLLALTDSQMEVLFHAAARIPIERRAQFLNDLARAVIVTDPADITMVINRLQKGYLAAANSCAAAGDHCERHAGTAA